MDLVRPDDYCILEPACGPLRISIPASATPDQLRHSICQATRRDPRTLRVAMPLQRWNNVLIGGGASP